MDSILNEKTNPKLLSPQTLAFMGDTVYEFMVREHLVCEANRPVGELNKRKVSLVNCEHQAEFAKRVMPILTEEELAVFKRGRNAFTHNVPKNSSVADYHAATGVEALFGYLYLSGNFERLRELFELVIE